MPLDDFPSSPYPPLPPGVPACKVAARVSPEDYLYWRRLFPMSRGPLDAILATLYHDLISSLRRAGIDPIHEFDRCAAWHVDHPTREYISSLLTDLSIFLQRRADRIPFGEAGPRDDERGIDPLREKDGDPAQQCADNESRSPSGQRATGSPPKDPIAFIESLGARPSSSDVERTIKKLLGGLNL